MSATTFFLLSLFYELPFYYLLFVPFEEHLQRTKRLMLGALLCLAGSCLLIHLLAPLLGTESASLHYVRTAYTLLAGLLLLYLHVDQSLPKLLCNLFLIKCYIDAMDIFMGLIRDVLEAISFLTDPILSTIFTCLFLLLLTAPSLIYYLRNLFEPLLEEQGAAGYWHKLWLIPAVFWLLLTILTVTTNVRGTVASTYLPERFTACVIWTLGTFMSCGILLQLLRETGRKMLIEERLRLANLHLLMQRKEYGRLQNVIDLTRKQRHDMRQQLSVIKGLAEQQNFTGILDYVEDYLHTSQIESSTVLCDNYALNAILQYYQAQARADGIDTEITVSLPAALPLPESDLAAILGNLVENALDGCRSQKAGHKFLQVKGNLVNGTLIALTVRNSYGNLIIRDGEAFISTKRQEQVEGIGIASIRSIALRYRGVTKFTYNKNIFQASVLLNPDQEA
ncbi:MAG: ATP-binding protein [Acidaminococcaceae bacterium]|nr:ATP-binding protein [Acidaminococcaceae bacterium]